MNNPADTLAALAPCPFCGTTGVSAFQENASEAWLVSCDQCVGAGPPENTKAEAIAAWNRRASLKGEAEPVAYEHWFGEGCVAISYVRDDLKFAETPIRIRPLIYGDTAPPPQQAGMSALNDGLERFKVQVEKRLCTILGKRWQPAGGGICIDNLCEEIAARLGGQQADERAQGGVEALIREAAQDAWEAYTDRFATGRGLVGPIDSEMELLGKRLALYPATPPAQQAVGDAKSYWSDLRIAKNSSTAHPTPSPAPQAVGVWRGKVDLLCASDAVVVDGLENPQALLKQAVEIRLAPRPTPSPQVASYEDFVRLATAPNRKPAPQGGGEALSVDAIRRSIQDAMLTGTGVLRIEHVPIASVSFATPPAQQPGEVAVTDEMVEAGARAICKENLWDPDEPVTYSGTKRKVRNRDGSIVVQWQMHETNVRAALTAALTTGGRDDG